MESKLAYVPFLSLFDWCVSSKIGSRQGKKQGKYKLYISSATEIKRYDDYLEEGDSLVFGTGGNPSIHLASGKFAYTNHTECAKSRDKNINLKYYYYYFQMNNFLLLRSTFVGGGIKNSSKKKIGALLVPKLPLEEQNRIVQQIEEQLSELDSAVETLKKTKQQLEVYRQAVLKEAFEGKLSKNRKVDLNLPFIAEAEAKELPTIPKEWKYVKLSFLGELARGKSKHRPRNDKKLFENGKYPFIQTGDVKNANKYITGYTTMYGEYGLQQSKLWKADTLCITIAANIAETAFLGIDACFPDSIVGFLPSENVFAEYVRFFIDSQKVRLWAYAPATAQKNINLKTLENLVVPYCSLKEQQEIVRIIEEKMTICSSILDLKKVKLKNT